jgi:UDP-N-acetylmuramoyl-L-alanyl-D-glutamate--2,6-diaminopimelate ligase
MRLSELLKSIDEPLMFQGDMDLEISGLYYDSRAVVPGGMFFALKGAVSDGHRFVSQARSSGAAAFVVEDESCVPAGMTFVKVADSREAMSLMASAFYGHPSSGLPLIGITGTNGKTTTTYIIESIMEKADIPTAVLGTINYRYRDTLIPAPNTTPESVDLQQILRRLVDLGARGIVMEVSSHALEQRRVDGCKFDIGVFTNLTRDHLDYHHDMPSYLASKKRLFSELLAPDRTKKRRFAVVNIDDHFGHLVARAASCPVVTFGIVAESKVSAKDLKFSTSGITGILSTPDGEIEFRSRLLGRFNLYNILAAAATGFAMKIPLETIAAGIEEHGKVAGRLEPVDNNRSVTLLVDYAHTGDALENVLKTVIELASGRVITVFGCGGDRDRGKRPIMGEIAGRYSDLSIITSDNPRTEEPRKIMAEVRAGILPLGLKEYSLRELGAGFSRQGFICIESRRDAIRLAVRLANSGDIILVAGKGHEDYQIIGTERHHFDDREEARLAFKLEGAV